MSLILLCLLLEARSETTSDGMLSLVSTLLGFSYRYIAAYSLPFQFM